MQHCAVVSSGAAVDPITKMKIGEFDEYVQPMNGAVWTEGSMAVHRI